MLISLSRRTAFALLVVASSALAAVSGCSRQAEGERCERANNGNADCEDGLVCKEIDSCTKLDRCCPGDDQPIGNDACIPIMRVCSGGSGGGAGTSGNGGGGMSGGNTGGTSGGGTSGADTGGTAGTDPDPTSGAGGEPADGAGGA